MTPNDHRYSALSYRSLLRPPPVGVNRPRLIGGAAAALLVLGLLLTFASMVQAQVERGEQFRQHWNTVSSSGPVAAPAFDGTVKVAASPAQPNATSATF